MSQDEHRAREAEFRAADQTWERLNKMFTEPVADPDGKLATLALQKIAQLKAQVMFLERKLNEQLDENYRNRKL